MTLTPADALTPVSRLRNVDANRVKVNFESGDTTCAAWHYPGTNGACLVMAGGLAVVKEPATDRFARRFQEAGFSVLAFDFRRLGESGGAPRQVVRLGDERADMRAAVTFARTLPEVDPAKVVLWGFSLSGGHVFVVAARDAELAAAIAMSPFADGPAASRAAAPHQTPQGLVRFMATGLLDMAGGALGRQPRLVPLAGRRGDVAVLTSPSALTGATALDPDGKYTWRQQVAARSAMRMSLYRPGRFAKRIKCPLLVLAYDQDDAALPGPAVRAGSRARFGEVVSRPGGHYEPYLGGHDEAFDVQLRFLRRHVLQEGSAVGLASGSTELR